MPRGTTMVRTTYHTPYPGTPPTVHHCRAHRSTTAGTQNVRNPEISDNGVLGSETVSVISGIEDCAWLSGTVAVPVPVPVLRPCFRPVISESGKLEKSSKLALFHENGEK